MQHIRLDQQLVASLEIATIGIRVGCPRFVDTGYLRLG